MKVTTKLTEKISEFVFKEAELSISAGILSISSNEVTPSTSSEVNPCTSNQQAQNPRKNKKFVGVINNEKVENQSKNKSGNARCAHCGRKNHSTSSCHDFAKITVTQRWKLAKSARLCYNCLEEGHSRGQCTSESCKHCHRKHHSLLHFRELNSNALSNASGVLAIDVPAAKTNNTESETKQL